MDVPFFPQAVGNPIARMGEEREPLLSAFQKTYENTLCQRAFGGRWSHDQEGPSAVTLIHHFKYYLSQQLRNKRLVCNTGISVPLTMEHKEQILVLSVQFHYLTWVWLSPKDILIHWLLFFLKKNQHPFSSTLFPAQANVICGIYKGLLKILST